MIDIIYFGTDEFSAQTLEALVNTRDFKILSVVTQPNRPVGRHQDLIKSPVKLCAEKYELPVLQPDTLKNFQFPLGLSSGRRPISNFQLSIVYRYGLIIPQNILDIPAHGTINIHPSLLPKYRGPTPIPAAIMSGESETGITIMLMDEKMDHGPILAQKKFALEPDDTYLSVCDRMTPLVNDLLLKTITLFLNNEIKPEPQDESKATYSKILSREDGKIDWTKSAQEIYNQFRALTPWPGVWTTWEGKRLKLLKIKWSPSPRRRGTDGEVSLDTNNRIFVACGEDTIEILELQLEGKKAMTAAQFIQGYSWINGEVLD